MTAPLKLLPPILSLLLLMAGGLLLLSSALPAIPEHLSWVQRAIPLAIVELSHLTSSMSGLFLLFLARGVWLRLDSAYYSCIVVLILGILGSVLKGFDWREAVAMAGMLALVLPSGKYFYRKASIFTMSFTLPWVIIIGVIVTAAAAAGFEAYKNVNYVQDMWWQFSYRDEAARFLRGFFITALLLLAYVLNNIFRVSRPQPAEKLTAADLADLRAIAGKSHDAISFLSLLGDKSILWNTNRDAFIMYAMTPHYWVAMGDPVGNSQSFADLVWMFREQADHAGAHAVFYEVSDQHLPLYLDRGFTLLKMGEDARIPIAEFSIEGRKRENMRKSRNKLLRENFTFRVLEKDEIIARMAELRHISDSWLKNKSAREKGFSLGFFNEQYLPQTRIAVAEREGRIYAFATLWELDNREQISMDLMRYDPSSPPSIMEFVFVESILWAREQNYQSFCLGMAPLSGMERHELAPLWHKIGRIIFERGEDFYNFEGLHAYKSKFDPVWKPRYIAAPPGPRIPLVLLAIARIIAGSMRGIFAH